MSTSEKIGRFRGAVHPAYDSPHLRSWLEKLPDVPESETLSTFQEHVHRVRPPEPCPPLVLKAFDLSDDTVLRPGLARQAFEHACRFLENGVPTPRPVAWLEHRGGKQKVEQYLLTEYLPDTCTFQEALLHHYYDNPLCSEIMELLAVCAGALRSMHDSGFEHRGLGNPHLLVRRKETGGWERAWVLDLHHGHFHSALSPARRGKDMAGFTLPSDLLRVFVEMLHEPQLVPAAFERARKKGRACLRRRRCLSRLRHPLSSTGPESRPAPSEKDIWIWDDRSMQAIPALKSRDKRKYYRKSDILPILSVNLRYRSKIKSAFRQIKAEAWTRPVEMDLRIGLSINLEPDRFEKERRWLQDLGAIPLLVRLYHHQSEANQRFAIEAVRKLNSEGHRVSVALVQDRRAVTHPSSWQGFVEKAGGGLSGFVEAFEVGHAINRVKWGIWNIPEYRQLLKPFENWSCRFPQIPLMGPAGIDFEYPRVLPMLDQWPENSLTAFSHHLYVDRRGDPENRQSGYDTLDKLALARAISRVHPATGERVVVSEVNWPLKGTGVWSPVGSPYQSPGERHNDPSVDEETYARYMRKYLLIAVCSGMADQVYWWNLAAHGFGLIDDRDPRGWRPRAAFHAFKALLDETRGSRYLRRESGEGETGYVLEKKGKTKWISG